MVNTFRIIATFCVPIFACVACNDFYIDSKHTGGIAIIDLLRIAQQTGRSQQISEALTEAQNDLNQQLSNVQTELQKQLQTHKSQMGESLDDEQRRQFGEMTGTAQRKLKQAQTQAQQALAKKQTDLIAEFRNEIRPIAKKVASQYGYSIVMVRNEQLLLDYEPQVDITDEIIAEVIRQMPGGAHDATKQPDS